MVARLIADGHDVERAGGLDAGAEDFVVLERATAEQRLVITEDRDFGDLVVNQGVAAVGVLLLELDRLSNEAEAARVGAVVAEYGHALVGQFCTIEPGRTRLRALR